MRTWADANGLGLSEFSAPNYAGKTFSRAGASLGRGTSQVPPIAATVKSNLNALSSLTYRPLRSGREAEEQLGSDNTGEDQAWLEKLERAMTMLIEDPSANLDGHLATVIEMRAEIRARRAASDPDADHQ